MEDNTLQRIQIGTLLINAIEYSSTITRWSEKDPANFTDSDLVKLYSKIWRLRKNVNDKNLLGADVGLMNEIAQMESELQDCLENSLRFCPYGLARDLQQSEIYPLEKTQKLRELYMKYYDIYAMVTFKIANGNTANLKSYFKDAEKLLDDEVDLKKTIQTKEDLTSNLDIVKAAYANSILSVYAEYNRILHAMKAGRDESLF